MSSCVANVENIHNLIIGIPNDYQGYKSLCAQTKVRSFPNPTGTARQHTTWKYKHILRKMVMPGERITEESEDSDGTGHYFR